MEKYTGRKFLTARRINIRLNANILKGKTALLHLPLLDQLIGFSISAEVTSVNLRLLITDNGAPSIIIVIADSRINRRAFKSNISETLFKG